MAIKNVGGHGVTTTALGHNMQAASANIQFPQPPAHQSGGAGGPVATDKGAYASRSMAKRDSSFPPATK